MFTTFAATDPVQALSSGNYLLLLAFIIVVLAGVIIAIVRYFIKKLDDKDAEIKALNQLIYTDGKAHAADYKEVSNDYRDVVQLNSQNMALFGEKIEVAKGRR